MTFLSTGAAARAAVTMPHPAGPFGATRPLAMRGRLSYRSGGRSIPKEGAWF